MIFNENKYNISYADNTIRGVRYYHNILKPGDIIWFNTRRCRVLSVKSIVSSQYDVIAEPEYPNGYARIREELPF